MEWRLIFDWLVEFILIRDGLLMNLVVEGSVIVKWSILYVRVSWSFANVYNSRRAFYLRCMREPSIERRHCINTHSLAFYHPVTSPAPFISR